MNLFKAMGMAACFMSAIFMIVVMLALFPMPTMALAIFAFLTMVFYG